MFKFLFLILLSPTFTSPSTLQWGVRADSAPQMSGFTHWYGSVNSTVVYGRKKTVDGLEVELHLNYSNRILTSASLYFGPSGIDTGNCFDVYLDVIESINKKYGHFIYKKETEDPMGYDLVYDTKCKKVLIELNQYIAYWKFKNISIEAWLYGDGDRILISVDYIFMKSDKLNKIKKLL